jgi:ABC-type enterochelin transport system substrate-binding protein
MYIHNVTMILFMTLVLALSLVFVSCGNKETKSTGTSTTAQSTQQTTSTVTPTKAPEVKPEPPKIDPEKVVAVIDMQKGGKIVFEFYPKDAHWQIKVFTTG